jgi:hypothetical protein
MIRSSTPKLEVVTRAASAASTSASAASRVTGRACSVPRNGRRRAAVTWPTRWSTSARTAASVRDAAPPASTSTAAMVVVLVPATGRSLR